MKTFSGFEASYASCKYRTISYIWVNLMVMLTLEVTNDNFHGVHRLELYIVAF